MKYEINKIHLLEEFQQNFELIKKIKESSIMTSINKFFKTIKDNFFKEFKYLNQNEIDIFMEFIYWHYYRNSKLPNNFYTHRDHVDLVKIFQKIKDNNTKKLPQKLYRGITFKTKSAYDDFIKNSKKNGYQSINTITGKLLNFSSWSSSKKKALEFIDLKGFAESSGHKYSTLLEIDKSSFKDKIVFNMEYFLEDINEKKKFVKMIFSQEFSKNIKILEKVKHKNDYIKMDDRLMLGKSHGTLFGLMEDEYIVETPAYNNKNILLYNNKPYKKDYNEIHNK